MHFHDLRHAGNHYTASAGANLRELMERMGHSTNRAAMIYLHSTDPRQRAELNRWLLFTATELEQPLWRIARHTAIYREQDRLPEDVTLASREFVAMAEIMERHMQHRQFVVGSTATVADFVLAYTLDWGNEVKLLGHCPKLLAYMEEMYARPRAPMRIAAAFRSIRA